MRWRHKTVNPTGDFRYRARTDAARTCSCCRVWPEGTKPHEKQLILSILKSAAKSRTNAGLSGVRNERVFHHTCQCARSCVFRRTARGTQRGWIVSLIWCARSAACRPTDACTVSGSVAHDVARDGKGEARHGGDHPCAPDLSNLCNEIIRHPQRHFANSFRGALRDAFVAGDVPLSWLSLKFWSCAIPSDHGPIL